MLDLTTLVGFRDRAVHLTGIKGTGMAAIAEVLKGEGAHVTGSDVADVFYTDELLARIGVVPTAGFAADHVPPETELLVYSSAYGPDNAEREEAKRRGLLQMSYSEILGLISSFRVSLGVSGVHGKTSTTAMLGTMIVGSSLPATVVVGSAVPSFGGSATLRQGGEILIAETCEYRRHFLTFHPTVAMVTAVEHDHQDYYRDQSDVFSAFEEYTSQIKAGGALVYCADDAGAVRVAEKIRQARKDLAIVPYGFSAEGPWRCELHTVNAGRQFFTLGDSGSLWELAVPGRHMIANAAGAVAALTELVRRYGDGDGDGDVNGDESGAEKFKDLEQLERWRRQLALFRGTRRRSEVIAVIDGITMIDDYAHHPTAISVTLAGFREFYPGRRLLVDFMSHTYSRTAALLEQFGCAFKDADMVILNDIYASAREHNTHGVTGERLFQEIGKCHSCVEYHPDFEDAARRILEVLIPGDVLITMGAGDNYRIGRRVEEILKVEVEAGMRSGGSDA
jgi:UDP-N-acetylmuramate--alanine ligase